MKFYEDQVGPVLYLRGYGEALRRRLFERGTILTKPDSQWRVDANEVLKRLLDLPVEELAKLTRHAAKVERAAPNLAEEWVLNRLGLLPHQGKQSHA